MRPLRISLSSLFAFCIATALGGAAAQAAPSSPEVAADDLASLNKIVNRFPQRYAGVVVDEAVRTVRVYVRDGEETLATADLADLPVPCRCNAARPSSTRSSGRSPPVSPSPHPSGIG